MTTVRITAPAVRPTSFERMLLRAAVALSDYAEARRARRIAGQELAERRAEMTDAQRIDAARFTLGMLPR